jgi:hypothetical protein
MTAFRSSGKPGAAIRPRRERFLQSPRKVVVPKYVPQLRLTTFVLDGLRAGPSESGKATCWR